MAHTVILPIMQLSEVCPEQAPGAIPRTIRMPSGPEVRYHHRLVADEVEQGRKEKPRWIHYNYNRFPVVLDQNGVPWDAATIFLLSKLQGQVAPNMTTYSSLASDLAYYLSFLEDSGYDYQDFPQKKLSRPTYRYHGHLQHKILAGETAASTAKRRMSTVIGFYRWMAAEKVFVPEFEPWIDKDRYLVFKDSRGFETGKKVITTDVSIRTPKQIDPFTERIDDGGKLRPLPLNEQRWLIEALASLGNPEMTLIHALMLATGARVQTALTFRVRHVQTLLPDAVGEVRLPVGPGTGIDTKNNKKLTLHLPRWLYERMRTYAISARAKNRRLKASGGDTDDQYLFLTQQGSPYYRSQIETRAFNNEFNIRHEKKGQTLRIFIADHVIPFVRDRHDQRFHYQVHDLRATYLMNLTDIQLSRVEKGEISLAQAREFVMVRAGHQSAATTDRYLNYRRQLSQIYAAVDGHETYFRDLIERAWEGQLNAA